MFILPDQILDNMNCDFCHKILSIAPVKVYRNGERKCGRCSEVDDNGVVSRYGLIANHCLFKCVNRFDGCRELLTFSDVAEHESKCKSKTIVCPLCPRIENVPIFMLIKHFEDNHQGCFLATPSFKVDVTATQTKMFLYRAKDNLFFIEFKNSLIDTISLNTYYVGEQKKAVQMKQKFIVSFGDDLKKVETETKACVPFGHEDSEGFLVEWPKIEFVYIVFEIVSDIFEIFSCSGDCSTGKKYIGLPRNISLWREFKQEHPEFSVSSSSPSTLLKNEYNTAKYKISIYCLNCSLPMMDDDYSFLEVKPLDFRFICHSCERYYKYKSDICFIPQNKICSVPLGIHLSYSCVWRSFGCLDFYYRKEIEIHETNCPYQPPQTCPVPDCTFKGTLPDLDKHFKDIHPENMISLLPHTTIYSSYYSRKWYIWAYYGFVLFEVQSHSNTHVSICALQEKGGKFQPRALLLTKYGFVDQILDNMNCDFCHKTLSVAPVKVYHNREIRCGRCSKDNDNGVVSKYGLIADQILFKCVNRFDGCRELLLSSDVTEHESKCESKTVICPLCPETEVLPTFMLPKHFRNNHQDCFLATPSFRVNVTATQSKMFLYRSKDNLFFIEFNTSVDTIGLNTYYLGVQKEAERMKHKFIVSYGDGSRQIETETKACVSFGCEKFEGFLLRKPEVQIVFIVFELFFSEIVELCSSHENSKWKNADIGLPRNISLDWGFRQQNVDFSVSSGSPSTLIKKTRKYDHEILVYCHNCSTPMMHGTYYLEVKPLEYHYICHICEQYYRVESPNIHLIPQDTLCSVPLKFHISHSCIWRSFGCSQMNYLTEVEDHETNCPCQPPQTCPVPNCSFEGKLPDLKEHFENIHPEDKIFFCPCATIPNDNSSGKYYVWAYYGFVLISKNGEEYEVFSFEEKGDMGELKLRALFFDLIESRIRFLGLATQECSVTIDRLDIWYSSFVCYFLFMNHII
ncbi:hypothetical protein JTB14_031288 [Gonioctena quinquepunctata]|nr:hypothetical protein JTB14_031288 [Gonioctena quinquepunctata]